MKQSVTRDSIVWQLPMVSAENNNTKFFEEINIEGADPKHLCKKCLGLYKKNNKQRR